jgi:lipid-A-disaccharide synthase
MIDVVRQWKNEFQVYQFCIPLAPNIDEDEYNPFFEALRQEGVVIQKGESVRVLAASDLAVIASGTATLQAAFLEVPMVVIYKLSPMTYFLGRLIIDVKYISLVNLLSGKGVVTELIQHKANPEDITKELKKILFDIQYKEKILTDYRLIKEPFSGKRASKRVADIIGEMAG